MTSSNYLFITANLGRDPELRYTNTGTAVTNFSLPADVGYGEKKDTEWIRVTVFGRQAEVCHEHLRKGSLVSVAGQLEKTYVNDEGKATIQVKALNVNFLANFGQEKD